MLFWWYDCVTREFIRWLLVVFTVILADFWEFRDEWGFFE